MAVNEYMPYGSTKNNLPGTVHDRKRLARLFRNDYGYTVRVLSQDRITLQEFKRFLEELRTTLERHHERYDAFIFAFTGYGHEKSIVLSDGQEYTRKDIYRHFIGKRHHALNFKNKLKLFFIDACKGVDYAPPNKGVMASRGGKHDRLRLDDNFVIFHSNADRYVSGHHGSGSAMLYSLYKVMKANKHKLLLGKMVKYIKKDVRELSRRMNTEQLLNCKNLGIEKEIYFDAPKYSG